jgi:nucleoside-diphosphate-sugar epimerase
MKEKVLITGGAGYIGSILTPMLLNQGYDVTVVDNFMYKQNSLNHVCSYKNFSVHNKDVRVFDDMKKIFADADIIIPLAAYVGAPLCKKDPVGATTVNKDSIFLMLDKLSKDQRVIMPTTNSAYGSGDENNFCTEESPLNPISQYAIEKVEVEKRLMEFENFISFRLATVFGMSPRMRIDLLVNDFTYRAVYDGFVVLFESHFKRNYIHVNDVCRAFLHAINNYEEMKGQIFNVGLSDTNISKFDLCKEINKKLPDFKYLEEPIGKDPDQRNYIVSNEKIESTGFKTETSLAMGIDELIKGFTMIKNSKYGNI